MGRIKLSKEEKKANLTININENLLKKVDDLIGEDKRSRLIEKLLFEYIEKKQLR